MTAFTNLNLGSSPDDGTGTTLRAGGTILNANFALAANISESNTLVAENNFTANQGIDKAILEAWDATYSALEVGDAFALTSTSTVGVLVKNAYFDGDWKYIANGAASRHLEFLGTHRFDVAASGTAGAVITWLVALEILVDGGIKTSLMKTGITQVAAGAAAGELWSDTDDDNTVKLGV